MSAGLLVILIGIGIFCYSATKSVELALAAIVFTFLFSLITGEMFKK